MPTSVQPIVSAYVRLRNRQALENMRDLRRQLLGTVQTTSGIDPAQSRNSIVEDLLIIEDGLEQLRQQPALGQ